MEDKSKKWKTALGRIHLSVVILLLAIGILTFAIGTPTTAYDKYVIEKGRKCAIAKTDELGITSLEVNEFQRVVEPKDKIDEILKTCRLESIRLSNDNKYEAYSDAVIWDNAPDYAPILWASLFFIGLAGLLVLLKRWLIWIVS